MKNILKYLGVFALVLVTIKANAQDEKKPESNSFFKDRKFNLNEETACLLVKHIENLLEIGGFQTIGTCKTLKIGKKREINLKGRWKIVMTGSLKEEEFLIVGCLKER